MTEILTVGGLILGVLVAYWKIQQTHKANIQAQEAHLRNQLKVRIYEHSTSTFEHASDLISKSQAGTEATIISLRMGATGYPFSPTDTWQELTDAHSAALRAVTDVLKKLEQYEIAFARFGSIRRELSEGHRTSLEAFGKLSSKLAVYLPNTHPETGAALPPITVLKKKDLPELEQLHEGYRNICNDMACYIVDLQIEAQNELLGSLFDHTLPPRHPEDPDVKVLTRDADAPTERPQGALVERGQSEGVNSREG